MARTGRLYVTHDGEFVDATSEAPKHLIRAVAGAPIDVSHAARVGADPDKLAAYLAAEPEMLAAKEAATSDVEDKDAGSDENKGADDSGEAPESDSDSPESDVPEDESSEVGADDADD